MGQISNQHVWNFKPSQNTKSALLDLLCVVLEITKSLFIYFVKISRIFEKQIIPTISQMLKNVQNNKSPALDSFQGIRVCKAAIIIIDQLNCIREDDLDESLSSNGSSKR